MLKEILVASFIVVSAAQAMDGQPPIQQSPAGQQFVEPNFLVQTAICLNSEKLVSYVIDREFDDVVRAYQYDRTRAIHTFYDNYEGLKWSVLDDATRARAHAQLENDFELQEQAAKIAHAQRLKKFREVTLPAYVKFAQTFGSSSQIAQSQGLLRSKAMLCIVTGSLNFTHLVESALSGDVLEVLARIPVCLLQAHLGVKYWYESDNHHEYVAECKSTNERICDLLSTYADCLEVPSDEVTKEKIQ